MTSNISVEGVDLDDLEQQMRTIPISNRSKGLSEELARLVGRSLGGHSGGSEPVASQRRVGGSFEEDKAHDNAGPAQHSGEPLEEAFQTTERGAGGHEPKKGRSRLTPRALVLFAPFLLVGGVGLALVVSSGTKVGSGTDAPVIKGEGTSTGDAPVTAAEAQASSRPVPETVNSLPTPDRVDVALGTNPDQSAAVVSWAEGTTPMSATDGSPLDPPRPGVTNSMSSAPPPASKESGKSGVGLTAKSSLEAVPLPPARPRTLVLADTTVPGKQLNAGANAAGSSFSIQLASSHSRSDALAALSRLKKQFPNVLSSGAIRRADAGASALYVVQAGPLTHDAADKACARLKASGESCIVVHG